LSIIPKELFLCKLRYYPLYHSWAAHYNIRGYHSMVHPFSQFWNWQVSTCRALLVADRIFTRFYSTAAFLYLSTCQRTCSPGVMNNSVKIQPGLTQNKDLGYAKLRHSPPNSANIISEVYW